MVLVKIKNKKKLILKTFAFFVYTLSIISICAGIVGIKTTTKNFENKETANNNLSKTVSTKDLMASVQRINAKLEAERKAKEEAERKAKEEAERKAREAAIAALATTAPKGEIQQYAHDLVIGSYGWSEADFAALVKLWNRESGWNPNSRNSYSGACGIPQALPCSKIANAFGDNSWQSQVKWGLRYISGRYGSPSNAWAHSESVGWY